MRISPILTVLCGTLAGAQNPQSATFQSKVELVLVPVVVRDSRGAVVGNLTKDDFQLFDKGKRQTIASFSAIRRAGAVVRQTGESSVPAQEAAPSGKAAAPVRNVIYFFDDLNIGVTDIPPLQKAAIGHLQSTVGPNDHVAIYSTTGRASVDFTHDKEKLTAAITKLRPQLGFQHGPGQCPEMSFFLADLIINKSDPQALNALARHTMDCAKISSLSNAINIVEQTARRELPIGEEEARVMIRALRIAIRQLAQMPGERMIVLSSPGVFAQTGTLMKDTADLLDRAVKANVIVSAIDGQGIEAEGANASERNPLNRDWLQYRRLSIRANQDVLADLVEGTGGVLLRNNNDLNIGFNQAASPLEFSYMLGFSPVSLKRNGSFRPIKVTLVNGKGFKVAARHGYFDGQPKEQTERASIDDAVFSREQSSEIPVVLQTGFSKPATGDPKIRVIAKLDVMGLHFKKVDGLDCDSLTAVIAVFDPEGSYMGGNLKTVNLSLPNGALEKLASGVTLRSEFEVKPGTYLVRFVIRDSEGKSMTSLNREVIIP